MTGRGPRVYCNKRGGFERTGGHATPLWVEKNLQVVRPGRKRDCHNRHTRVWLIWITGRCGRVGREASCCHCRYLSAARWRQERHRHRLTIKCECGGGAARVDVDSSVRMHSPHDPAGGIDLVLQEYLCPPIDCADTALVRCSDGSIVSRQQHLIERGAHTRQSTRL